MHPEVEEIKPKLKEVLYDCAVDVRATKAALYFYDGATRFELVTEYGFRGGVRQSADFNDPLIDRCGRGRTPFFINGVATEPRFSELLFESSTDRLLAVPLYTRGKLIGVIDMRDKAGKQLFEQSDLGKAQAIADRIVALVANKNIFGHRFISLSESDDAQAQVTPPAPPKPAAPASPVTPPAAPAAPRPAAAVPRSAGAVPQSAHLPRLAALVHDARAAAAAIGSQPAEELTEAEVTAATEVLRTILVIPGAVVAVFSAFGHLGGVQEIASRSTLTDEAKTHIQSKITAWLSKRGEAAGFVRTTVHTPFGTTTAPVIAGELEKVFTAPLSAGAVSGMYLTVAFAGVPDRVTHELLAAMHAHLQLVIEQSLQRTSIWSFRLRAAERLVEPEFSRYQELRHHAESVASLTDRFARFLALPQPDVENARLVALVHDAGMRLLDYDRLYRKNGLSQEELWFLREHVAVSAAMAEPLLGGEVARAVLCHHERVDGLGYPSQLRGEEIPLLSRIVQICDAYLAMTDPQSYQQPESAEAGLDTILRAAGTQFDAQLAARFVELMKAES